MVHAENLGSDNYLFVDIGSEEPVLVRQEGKTSIPWGANIGIRPIEENLHRFDDKRPADPVTPARPAMPPPDLLAGRGHDARLSAFGRFGCILYTEAGGTVSRPIRAQGQHAHSARPAVTGW